MEIRLESLLEDLEVSMKHARSEFNELQMEEIRLGLREGLDVSVYAKPELSWVEMNEIRRELEKANWDCKHNKK